MDVKALKNCKGLKIKENVFVHFSYEEIKET